MLGRNGGGIAAAIETFWQQHHKQQQQHVEMAEASRRRLKPTYLQPTPGASNS